MARRKEVFQSKVLQKLYSVAPKFEKAPSLPHIEKALTKKNYVERNSSQEEISAEAGKAQNAGNPGRQMYTVLPPPADYKTNSEKSITLSQPESMNIAQDLAEESIHDAHEELDQDKKGEDDQKIRRRRRRKRNPALPQGSGKDGAAPPSESCSDQKAEGGEHVSRNKKRKLKKKRHKEKLLSMGLIPQATALEFTYKRDWQEQNDETRAAEVSDFLRTTLEIYMSDSSLHADKRTLLSEKLDDLLSSIASGCKPTSVLKQLYSLKAVVQQRDTDKLEKALKEFVNTSCMSTEETTAVVSLLQYWITDILPMQGNRTTVP